MTDAVDDLIEHPQAVWPHQSHTDACYCFHKANRQVLDFVVSEMRVDQANGWKCTSASQPVALRPLVLTRKHRLPGESFAMSNNLFPHYGRIIAVLHPDLNGFFGMAKSQADDDFGTTIEPTPKDAPRGYIRRLLWSDRTPIENGWRPATPHEPKRVNRRERVRRYAQ